jgi:multiple sugar transport system substrate-binding protein
MGIIHKTGVSRRDLMAGATSLGAMGAVASSWSPPARAQAAPINLMTWSAAVDQVKSHISAFEAQSGLKVAYENAPGAQFRQTLVTKFVGNAPMDVMWVSDAWLPEFAEAQWLAPIDGYSQLTKYNSDIEQYCVDSMVYKGKQYGNVYYTDYMAFLYNEEMLKRAGISAPPTTWDEVVEQSLRLKERNICEHPMLLSLQSDVTWYIEFMSALAFSFGGSFVDGSGRAIMNDPSGGVARSLEWVRDAVHKHKIVSPAATNTSEIAGLKAFGAGQHAFGIIPRYRIRPLNSPAESQVAGNVRMAMMPKGGPNGTNATCGWVRFYGLSAATQRNAAKAANAVKLIEWFGGKAMDSYTFQKMIILDLGLPYCTKPLDNDADIVAFYDKFAGGNDVIRRQAAQTRKKDVVTTWFGEWNDVNIQATQKAILNQISVVAALNESAQTWERLRTAK